MYLGVCGKQRLFRDKLNGRVMSVSVSDGRGQEEAVEGKLWPIMKEKVVRNLNQVFVDSAVSDAAVSGNEPAPLMAPVFM